MAAGRDPPTELTVLPNPLAVFNVGGPWGRRRIGREGGKGGDRRGKAKMEERKEKTRGKEGKLAKVSAMGPAVPRACGGKRRACTVYIQRFKTRAEKLLLTSRQSSVLLSSLSPFLFANTLSLAQNYIKKAFRIV